MIAGYPYGNGNGNGREYIENMGDKITIISNVENHTRAFESLVLGRGDYMLGYKVQRKSH